MKRELKLSSFENFMYYLSVICTFGGSFFLKIVIKKAILDAKNEE